jgi:hypothetical protein
MMHLEGPIGTEHSSPDGSAFRAAAPEIRLLTEFEYVEEEFFVSGRADVYGPESARRLAAADDLYAIGPLSTVCERDVPYKTRVLVVRPRDATRFSGVVHAIPFHNLGAGARVERHLVRRGDAWVGVEVCSSTRFGRDEIPSGGIANLHRADPDRYSSLSITGGKPEHWPDLTPGALGKAFESIDFGKQGRELMIFR